MKSLASPSYFLELRSQLIHQLSICTKQLRTTMPHDAEYAPDFVSPRPSDLIKSMLINVPHILRLSGDAVRSGLLDGLLSGNFIFNRLVQLSLLRYRVILLLLLCQ